MASPRVKTEVLVLGSSATALFVVARLLSQGVDVTLINPSEEFHIDDLRQRDGHTLWRAAYRANESFISLPAVSDALEERLSEALPVAVQMAHLQKMESWSVLSRTPVHAQGTAHFESEYLRLERKKWSGGLVRLLPSDMVHAFLGGHGVRLGEVSMVEGAVQRSFAFQWDHLSLGRHLQEFTHRKHQQGQCRVIEGCRILSRLGRSVEISQGKETFQIEYSDRMYILLSGDLTSPLRSIIGSVDLEVHTWLKSLRRRKREMWWSTLRRQLKQGMQKDSSCWLSLGSSQVFVNPLSLVGVHSVVSGPDSQEQFVDELLRLSARGPQSPWEPSVFSHSHRAQFIEWEWKTAQWKPTEYGTFWGTGFENDAWNTMELVWTLPLA